MILIRDPDDDRGRVRHFLKPGFADTGGLLGPATASSVPGVPELPLDRHCQTGEIRLENVVRRTRPHHLDSKILTDSSGYDDDRQVQIMVLGHF